MKTNTIVLIFVGAALAFGLYLMNRNRVISTQVLKTGATVVTDTVIRHDTVTSTKTVRDISVRTVVVTDTVWPNFTEGDSLSVQEIVQDTAVCYSFGQSYKNGAYAYAEMCSKYFPSPAPADIRGQIKYFAGPDTIKREFRTDTLKITLEKTATGKLFQTAIVGVAVGVMAMLVLHR